MTAEAEEMNNLADILGPEPTVEEESTEQAPVEAQPEPQAEAPAEPIQEETASRETEKQTPEQIAENYKRMAHAERMERKAMQEQMKVMQQRFEQVMSVAPKPEVAPAPVYEEDPLGATFDRVEKVSQKLERLEQNDVQRQQQEQFQGFVRNVQADEAKFMEKSPDYKDAVNFIQHRRLQELQVMGYSEDKAMQVLASDAYAVTQRAIAVGESPAQFAYNMAKQLGYTPKQKANIETLAAGQQVARSVSGGAQPVSEGSLPTNLAEMSDAEFDAMFKKMSKG